MARNNLFAVQTQQGVSLARHSDFADALLWFERAYALEPDDATAQNNLFSAHLQLGLSLAQQSDFAAALPHFEQAHALKPGDTATRDNLLATHTQLGFSLAQQSDFAAALPHYERVHELNPGDTMARHNLFAIHSRLGLLLAQQEKLDDALSHLETARSLNPDDNPTRSNLAVVYSQIGSSFAQQDDFAGAEPYYRRAFALMPESEGNFDRLFAINLFTLTRSGRFNELISCIDDLLSDRYERSPQTIECLFSTIDLLRKRGMILRAFSIFPHILRPGILFSKKFCNIYGLCVLGAPGLDAARQAIRQAPAEFHETPIGKLTNAIFLGKDEEIARAYNPYLICENGEYYETPIVDAFYMKHHLLSNGVDCARRIIDKSSPRISASAISWLGRFTHALYDYLSTRLYADRHGLELETPEWVGQYFFDLDDPEIDQDEDRIMIERPDFENGALSDNAGGERHIVLRDVDIFYPRATIITNEYKDRILGIVKIRPYWIQYFSKSLDYLSSLGRTLICIHVRLGDREKSEAPLNYAAYEEWLDERWAQFESPVLYIASDNAVIAKSYFNKYAPVVLEDLPISLPMASYLLDFYVLLKSDVFAISRGGFGWIAAALRDKPDHNYRLTKDGSRIVPFDPWLDFQ